MTRSLKDGIVIGVTQAIILVLVVALIVMISGNQQQKALNDIRASNRAIACVLLLPVTVSGRSEIQANTKCLKPNGLAPIDADGNGTIEGGP
jgi:hypothetical protein